jgi:hypothetical protein
MSAAIASSLVAHVQAQTPLPEEAARAALEQTLAAIGAASSTAGRAALREQLPPSFAAALELAPLPLPLDDGSGRERIAAACSTLAGILDDDSLVAARLACPQLAPWLWPPARAYVPVDRLAPPRETLSSGRPGSRHPLSEAAPRRGHRRSIARSKI